MFAGHEPALRRFVQEVQGDMGTAMNVASKVRKRQPLLLTVQDYRTLADAGAFEGRPRSS
jgi:hypothetical protein